MPKVVNVFQQRHFDWFAQQVPFTLVQLDLTEPELETLGKLLGEQLQKTNTKFSVVKWQLGWQKSMQAALKGEAPAEEVAGEEELAEAPTTFEELLKSAPVVDWGKIEPVSNFPPEPPPDVTDELFTEEDVTPI